MADYSLGNGKHKEPWLIRQKAPKGGLRSDSHVVGGKEWASWWGGGNKKVWGNSEVRGETRGHRSGALGRRTL